MTLADVYRFPTRHFEFHRHQLTIDPAPRAVRDEGSPGSFAGRTPGGATGKNKGRRHRRDDGLVGLLALSAGVLVGGCVAEPSRAPAFPVRDPLNLHLG